MSIPLVNLDVARRLYRERRPFRLRLEYRGENNENQSGWSSKWWELTYKGGSMVECNHGATGARGRSEPFRYEMSKAEQKVHEKRSKGYRYVSATSTEMPATQAAPKLVLVGPYAEIRLIRKVARDHYKAFDKDGNFLLDLSESGANALVDADPYRISFAA